MCLVFRAYVKRVLLWLSSVRDFNILEKNIRKQNTGTRSRPVGSFSLLSSKTCLRILVRTGQRAHVIVFELRFEPMFWSLDLIRGWAQNLIIFNAVSVDMVSSWNSIFCDFKRLNNQRPLFVDFYFLEPFMICACFADWGLVVVVVWIVIIILNFWS